MRIAAPALLASTLIAATVVAESPTRLGRVQPVHRDTVAREFAALDRPVAELLAAAEPLAAARRAGFEVLGDRVAVEVVVTSGSASDVARWLAVGGAHEVAWRHGDVVEAFIRPERLADLNGHPAVLWVRQPPSVVPPHPVVVPFEWPGKLLVISEGVEATNVEAWHADGYTGLGVKAGVIDTQAYGWEDLVGVELPPVDRFHFQRFGGTTSPPGDVHGTAIAEIIHDLAPEAELYLAQVGSGSSNFNSAVQWMIDQGVRVVAMSITYFGVGPGDGTGFFQERINDFVQEADGLWAHSAGNYRDSHWQGVSSDADGNGWVELAPGEEVALFDFGSSTGDDIRISMQWNDWTAVDQDYSLHLFRVDGDEPVEVASSDRIQSGNPGQTPTESLSFTVTESGRYGVGIFRKNVSGLNDMEFFSWYDPLEDPVEEGSITTPGDAEGAMATAALGAGNFQVRDYSSAGPTNGPGGSFTGGVTKPNISGYDGVSTVSYDGLAYGTSFAGPHVAGAAAVVMSAFPGWSGGQVRAFLEQSAIDREAVGMDNDTGWGRVNVGPPPGSTCSFELEQDLFEFDAGGGSAIIRVITEDDCFWTAERHVDWARVPIDNGTGSGVTVALVSANDGPTRTGTLSVAGHTVTLVQEGADCSYSVAPSEALFPAEGGRGEITVLTADGCDWTAATSAPFIELEDPTGGTGSGGLAYSVAANGSDAARQGEIQVAGATVFVNQPGITEGRRYLVAGVADTGGAAGSDWKTNLAVANLQQGTARLTLVYRHGSGETTRGVELPGGQVVEYENAAAELFGVPDSSGSVEVWSMSPVIVTARTFNDTPDGTYGQFLPGTEIHGGLARGQLAVLSQLRRSADFRTNVGFVNFGSDAAAVETRLFDGSGQPLTGGTAGHSVEPGGWHQSNRVFGGTTCEGCYATVELTGGEGPIWAYASVVDNRSGDPTTVPMEIVSLLPPDGDQLVAGIAEVSGTAGTNWKSNLAVLNRSGSAVQASLHYRHGGGTESTAIELAHGQLMEWENVASLLGAPDSSGAMAVAADGPLVVTARTFNDTPGGTYGQFLPGVGELGTFGRDGGGVLSQIKRTAEFRTNIGFTNFSGSPCDVGIELYGADGTRQGGDVFVRDIPAGGWKQRDRIFQAAGVAECQVGYAVLSVETPGCEVWAYASVVDNASGDPTTIPVMIP